jgi:shikimate 5-dehydrogenase
MRRFVFVGVTTGSSSIVRIFPRWRDVLGLPSDVELVGRDIPLGAPAEAFRETVAWLRDDAANLGALVTTHKIDVVRHARDLFDELDEHAERLGEVSCVARRDGRLLGWAKDPLTAARALDGVAPPGCFAAGGDALVLGAGGAGSAIAEHLLHRADRPARIVVTDRDPARLARLAALDGIEAVAAEGDANDRLLASLAPGSLVVNATGMGKDRPGSPLSDAARFPERAAVWELNYRGALDFLVQAQAQAAPRALRVEDGWRYFIHGWTAVIEEVFQRPLTADDVDLLAREADFARPPGPERRTINA